MLSLIGRFEQQVTTHPNSTAIITEIKTISYGELDAYASHFACQLQSKVQAGEYIAVVGDRSLPFIISLLALRKLSCVYVPILQTESPCHSLKKLTANAINKAILTSDAVLGHKTVYTTAGIECINAELHCEKSDRFTECNPVLNSPFNLLFTSGSTGDPKAVLNGESGMESRIAWMQQEYQLRVEDVVAFKTPPTFDVSGWEIWWPLTTGASIAILEPGRQLDPDSVEKFINGFNVSHVHFVPAMLARFLDNLPTCPSLKKVFSSGEALGVQTVRRFHSNMQAELHNLYGPTEAAIDVTYYKTSGRESIDIPIGQPTSNTDVLILNDCLEEVPEGNEGDLYLSGVQLAFGYSNNPKKTADSFRPNPHSKTSGAVMYRTGDRAKVIAGQTYYIGRADGQIKYNGQRIELSFVTNAIESMDSVKQCHLHFDYDRINQASTLTAFVIPINLALPVELQALQQHLQESWGLTVFPNRIINVSEFPYLTNGKVDRKALAESYPFEKGEDDTHIDQLTEPRITLKHNTFITICQKLLSKNSLNSELTFAQSGGDSIMTLRLIHECRKQDIWLDLNIDIKEKTLAQIDHEVANKRLTSDAPIYETINKGTYALTPIQQWFFAHHDVNINHFNQSYLFSLTNRSLGVKAIIDAWEQVACKHEAFFTTFHRNGQSWQPKINRSKLQVEFGTVDLSTSDQIADQLRSASSGFDICEGPLSKFLVISVAGKVTHIFISCHHLIVDGVSWRILMSEFDSYLSSQTTETNTTICLQYSEWASRLADFDTTFSESAVWDFFESHDVERTRLKKKNSDNIVEPLHCERSREFSSELSTKLMDLPTAFSERINTILLTALARGLCKLTGNELVTVQVEGHGRELLSEIVSPIDTVGWFTTIYPVVLQGNTDMSLIRLVEENSRMLEGVSSNGFTYGLQHQFPSSRLIESSGQRGSDVTFNFLGDFSESFISSNFKYEAHSKLCDVDLKTSRPETLYLELSLVNHRLKIVAYFDANEIYEDEIEALLSEFEAGIRQLVDIKKQLVDFNLRAPLCSNTETNDKLSLYRNHFCLIPHLVRAKRPTNTDLEMLHYKRSKSNQRYTTSLVIQFTTCVELQNLDSAYFSVVCNHSALRTVLIDDPFPLFLELNKHHDSLNTSVTVAVKPLHEKPILVKTNDGYELQWKFDHLYFDGKTALKMAYALLQELTGGEGRQLNRADAAIHLTSVDQWHSRQYWRNRQLDRFVVDRLPLSPELNSSEVTDEYHTCQKTFNFSPGLENLIKTLESKGIRKSTTLNYIWLTVLRATTGELNPMYFTTVRSMEFGNSISVLPICDVAQKSGNLIEQLLSFQNDLITISAHSSVSLSSLKAESHISSMSLLGRTLLNLELYDFPLVDIEAINVLDVSFTEGSSFPLTLSIVENYQSGSLMGKFIYSQELFNTFKLIKLEEAIYNASDAVSAAIECIPADSPKHGQPSETQVLESLSHRIAHAFITYQHKEALICDGIAFTYSELDEISGRIANYIQKHHLQINTVAIIGSFGIDFVASVLALARIGKTYLPIDEANPIERITYFLKDSNCELVLHTSKDFARCHFSIDQQFISNIYLREKHIGELISNFEVVDHLPLNLIYTSGSTGNPKGTLLSRKAISASVNNGESISFSAQTRMLCVASISFDASTFELWQVLLNGGCLIKPDETVSVIDAVARSIERYAPNTALFTPVLLNRLIETHSDTLDQMSVIYTGGEKAKFSKLSQFVISTQRTKLVHLYGPSENTVYSTIKVLDQRVDKWNSKYGRDNESVPIGRAAYNCGVYILDAQMNPVSDGVPGEIYVDGSGLAYGYLGKPYQTAQAFRPNPFSGHPGARMYKTGDVGWRNEHGDIVFKERLDNQVKISGYRIELSEITSKALRYDGLMDAHALILTNEDSNPFVALFVVVDCANSNTENDTKSGLLNYLGKHLPAYMLPESVVILGEFPTNVSGKVDEIKLKSLIQFNQANRSLPDDPISTYIAGVWKELLNLKEVYVEDNFFLVGGNSLKSMELLAVINESLGVSISVRDFNNNKTLRKFSELLENQIGQLNE